MSFPESGSFDGLSTESTIRSRPSRRIARRQFLRIIKESSSSQQLLRRDRRPPADPVHPLEGWTQLLKRGIRHRADRPQRVVLGYPSFRRRVLSERQSRESQLFKDNLGRVFTKLVPRKIQAWDFSKAPIGVDGS
jgi:hypothetical protein